MDFIADLHIHSRFSRATARNLDLPHLDFWAVRKGITVLGTGDLTHPQWLDEIREQLVEDEAGLFRLHPDRVQPGGGGTRFILTGEISNIYKKDGRVRKVHNLILMPGFEAARRLNTKLQTIGNLASDGRPILGLDARHLLELCLEASPESFFIPAHIWTPWFSLLGSKSGFDSIEECFEDLSPHIHALETGLSSDPPMNWRLSSLDDYLLVSNSDAHSPGKLGREANLFQSEPSYPAMMAALRGEGGFGGTIEFFPEEGKYHLDGHRKCGQRLAPEDTRARAGLCPVCGRPVTVGVMNRVMELADRPADIRPPQAHPFFSLIPLEEILAEILDIGPQSKKVKAWADRLIQELGPELEILRQVPLGDLERAGGDMLALAIRRMRAGQVLAEAGYDGEFGRISLFAPGELIALRGQEALFSLASPQKRVRRAPSASSAPAGEKSKKGRPARSKKTGGLFLVPGDPLTDDLNPEQRRAVTHPAGPLGIVAGPGTGKTLTLTRRAAWIFREYRTDARRILGLTFTRQAAGEMAARLAAILPFQPEIKGVPVLTFHGFGLRVLKKHLGREPKILSEEERLKLLKRAARGTSVRPAELLEMISASKQNLTDPAQKDDDPDRAAACRQYQDALAAEEAVDFDDLLYQTVSLLERDAAQAAFWRDQAHWLLVDEYQDINLAQYRLIRLLADIEQSNLTVIGDPDQAIYGFRGADSRYFDSFTQDYPGAQIVHLTRNYRSSETILRASGQVIARNPGPGRPELISGINGPARITTAVMDTPNAEAEYVVARIENLLGGSSHFSLYSGRAETFSEAGSTLGGIAILYRLHALAGPLVHALSRAGLPFQQAGEEPLHETDGLDFTAEKISLLSMHAAKGLEFDFVFIVGLEDRLLPYQPPQKKPASLEEERRLFYVALTRAKRQIFLTRSRRRTLYGKSYRPEASVFWHEIEERLKIEDALPDRPKKPKVIQLDLFS